MPRLFSWRRTTKVLVFLTLAVGVLFSYSRAAWLNLAAGLAVMVVVFSFRRGAGKQAARAVALVLVACVALGAVVSFTGSLSFLEQRAKVQTYDNSRFGRSPRASNGRSATRSGSGRGNSSGTRTSRRTACTPGPRRGRRPGFLSLLILMLGTLYWAGRNAMLGRDTYGVGSAACSPRGSGSSTASSWTRCTGAISGSWRG